MNVPLADTFHAIWGAGGPTLDASGRAMWPRYPLHYSKQTTSMLESGGKGDGIHPNVLGHLAIAKSVYRAIAGIPPAPPALECTAVSEWTPAGLFSHATVRNVGETMRQGRLEVVSLPDGDIRAILPDTYRLAPGGVMKFDVAWTAVRKPEDLLRYPANAYIAPEGRPEFAVIDYAGGGSTITAVAAPLRTDANFVRGRQRVDGNTVTVLFRQGGNVTKIPVSIPRGAEVGRIPLVRKVKQGGHTGYAAAEVAYVRYARADKGEATVDGSLDEWRNATWQPLGESVQARWTRGPEDGRASLGECYLRWAVMAGHAGVYIAMRGAGQLTKDTFTLFFDTRSPELLGTPGRYYWVSGSLNPNGVVNLAKGETTRNAPGMTGAWKATADGANLEMFIPYEAMELTAWPRSGDLGLSIWWRHANVNGGVTNLQWSEDGHPWNTRWYGVVRLGEGGGKPLPYMVRVK
jgi:hypothetical protein